MSTEFTDEDLRAAERFLEESVQASYGEPRKYQPQSNNASKCGHPCAWYLWAVRARHEDLPTPDPGMPGLWAIGREHENAAKIALLSQGWNLHRTEVTFEDKDLDIRGRIDWELQHQTHPFWSHPIPTEFKSVSPNYWGNLQTFDDCFESPMPWVRLWPMQALVYSYLMPDEVPHVCLLLRNKVSGRVRAIVERCDRHFHRLVQMGDTLAKVNAALRDEVEPECMPYDPVFCKKCDAAHICPTMQQHTYGNASAILEDPSVIDTYADKWAAGADAKKSSDAAWEELKGICKHYGLYDQGPGAESQVIGGRWVYKVKMNATGSSGRLKVEPLGGGDDD